MPLVPDTVVGKIAFYRARLDEWAASAAEIGLSASDVALLVAKVDAAEAAHAARQIKMDDARSATLAMHQAVDEMHSLGAADILRVRAKAAQTGDTGVYMLARLTPPKKASPIGEPTRPVSFSVELQPLGALSLTWKCKTPGDAGGTIYEVHRRLGDSRAPGEFLGVTSIKQFIDTTIPRGTSVIIYEVTPVRAAGGIARDRTRRGATGSTIVNFGTTDGSGGVRVASGTTAKIAA